MAVAALPKTGFEGVVTERLEADICELFGQISAAGARLVLMIAEFDDRQAWAGWGCRSAAHWLSWKCGVGIHAAREKLRVGHALAALPTTRSAFERGELSYSQVRSMTRIAGPHNEAALVAIASTYLTTHLAEGTGVDDYRTVVFADDTVTNPDPVRHHDHCDCRCSEDNDAPPVRDAPRAHLEGGAMLSAETIRRIWCDSTVTRVELRDSTITAIEEPTRTISAALRRALKLRDTQCRFPGCCAKRIDAHHIRYRSHKGPTTLTNLLSLCRFHHKLIHEGGYSVSRGADGDLRFHDPHGRQLHHRSNLVANDGADALRKTHQHLGINIEPDTIVGNHCGDKLDIHYAVSVLTKQNQPARRYATNTAEHQ
ncbi:MAG TPA: DUF222 domain-containing protein [Acidimicrobiales bacterium]|nr:DUF222 domain-containing protein [Acidimicrobiales bacterium]